MSVRVPTHDQALSYHRGPKHTVAMGTDFDFTVGQCLVSNENGACCRSLSDTRHCPMVTSKSICRTTEPDNGSGLRSLSFFLSFFLSSFYSCVIPLGFFFMRNTGCLPRGKPVPIGSRYPTYGAYWVF